MYYPDGHLKIESYYTDGKKNGKSIHYLPTGQINSIANYKDGHLVGEFVEYRVDKSIRSILYYDSTGKRTDSFKFWYDNHVLKQEGKDSNGIELWRSYYRSGRLQSKSYYLRTNKGLQKENLWKWYTEDGLIYKQELYKSDSLLSVYGPQMRLQEKPKITHLHERYNSNITGWLREYYAFDQRNIIRKETFYEQGKRNGKSVEYYENGDVLAISNYQKDQLFGKQVLYFIENQRQLESNYNENGNLDSEYISWYEDGQIKLKGAYKDGKKDGAWVYFSRDGVLMNKEYYKQGKLTKE